MTKIISAKLAVRKAVQLQLEEQIPLFNEAIKKAIEKDNKYPSFHYNGLISSATKHMLEKAGYKVSEWSPYGEGANISWFDKYKKISEEEIEKIAEKIDLKIESSQASD